MSTEPSGQTALTVVINLVFLEAALCSLIPALLHAPRARAAVPPETPSQRGAASGKRLVLVKAEFVL